MNSVAPELVETTTNQPAFDWSAPVTIDDKEEPADCLDRAKYAEFLTNYLSGFTDKSYVMNLNAEWGAGKTYFLKRWQETIKETYPTAYIDAWRNDFDDDPLLTVIAGITDALQQCPNARAYKFRQDMAKSAGHFLKKMAPTILKGLAKTYVGFDENEYKNWDVKLSNFDDAAEKLLESSLSEHKKKSIELDKFKNTIGKWLAEAKGSNANGTPHLPMFVFIDELDRCRPTYAIEMLEVIKHLFDIKGLVFVVATNTDQLQHSIKAIYGSDFDASTYLMRFFKRTYLMKKPDIGSFIRSNSVYKEDLSKILLKTCDEKLEVSDEIELNNILTIIASYTELGLRDTDQWLDQLKAIYVDKRNRNKTIWIFTALLLALKFKRNSKSNWKSIIGSAEEHEKKFHFKMNAMFATTPSILTQRNWVNGPLENNFINSFVMFEGTLQQFTHEVNHWIERDWDNKSEQMAVVRAADQLKNAISLANYYCYQGYGVKLDSYLDLVDLATDLR